MGVDAPTPTADAPPKPTQRRPFFSKSSVPKPKPADEEDRGGDFFAQPASFYCSIIADREKKLKAKALRKATDRKENSKSKSSDRDVYQTRGDGNGRRPQKKKRRTSRESDSDSDWDSGGGGKSDANDAVQARRETSPRRRRPSQTKASTPGANANGLVARYNDATRAPLEVVDLDSSDGEDPHKAAAAAATTRSIPHKPARAVVVVPDEEADDDDGDEDIREIIAKAQAKKREQELGAQKRGADAAAPSAGSKPETEGPVMQVLVRSDMSGCSDAVLIFRAAITRPMKDIKSAFCDYIAHKGMAPGVRPADVIVTWRGLPQYDYTTLKSMLVTVGDVYVDDSGGLHCVGRGEGLSDDLTKIAMLVTTPALHEERRARERADRESRSLHAVRERALLDDEAHVLEAPAAPKPEMVKVILRERVYGELKLKINPDDPFARLVNAFRRSKKVPDDAEVFLMFDGQRLDPDETMENVGIEAEDCIEVYVR